jgi:hypothetical protein
MISLLAQSLKRQRKKKQLKMDEHYGCTTAHSSIKVILKTTAKLKNQGIIFLNVKIVLQRKNLTEHCN